MDFSRFNIMGVALSTRTMRIGRIWGSRRIRQQAVRLLSLHQAEVRFDRFLDSVACIIATQWQRRRVVLLYGQLNCVCNRIRGFPSCLSGWEHLRFCPRAPKALPEVEDLEQRTIAPSCAGF